MEESGNFDNSGSTVLPRLFSNIVSNHASNTKNSGGGHKKPDSPDTNDVVWNAVAPSISYYVFPFVKTVLWVTLGLYVLNQKRLLPKPLSRVVSKSLFWPTLPITAIKRTGRWISNIDDTVVMGGAPVNLGPFKVPELLYESYNVRGVINLCEEFNGPVSKYKKLGIQHLRLPTVDHFEPSVEDLETAVSFIETYRKEGKGKVYVHCKAGHGRSAAIVFAWILYNDPQADRKALNEEFCKIRNVRSTLWKQENIKEFHSRLLTRLGNTDDKDNNCISNPHEKDE